MPTRLVALLALALTSAAAGAPGLARQNPAPASGQPATASRGSADLVTLDVTVRDSHGAPVRGLTRADFTIFEDGTPQPIATFSAVNRPDVGPTTAAWVRDVVPDVSTNELRGHGLVMLVLDEGVAENLWGARTLKASATQIIERLRHDDLAGIVFAHDNLHAQRLTNDQTKLLSAVNGLSSAPRAPAPCMGGGTPDVLAAVAEYFDRAAIVDRRKTVVYLGAGVPEQGTCPDVVCGTDPCGRMRDVLRAAQHANINIYTVDVCGLWPPEQLNLRRAPCGLGPQPALLALADNTGGRSFTSPGDFEAGIDRMFVDSRSYYLAGYRPTHVKADGTLRRLEVRVTRPDLEVRARRVFVAPPAAGPAAGAVRPSGSAMDALSNAMPRMDLTLRVAVAPFGLPGRTDAVVAIAVNLRPPASRGSAAANLAASVIAVALTDEAPASADRPIPLNLTAATPGSDDRFGRMDLKPGRYEFRVSAPGTSPEQRGTVAADVEVPDFAGTPLSLSGLVMARDVRRGVTAGPAGVLGGLVPVVPTTDRAFSAADRVSAFLRVYQGGAVSIAPVTLTMRIVDTNDSAVVDRRETLAVDRFTTGRAADITLAVPVDRLATGDYLLRIDASTGHDTIRREAPFTIG